MTAVSQKENKSFLLSALNFFGRNFFWVAFLISILFLIIGFVFLIKPKYEQITSGVVSQNEEQDQLLFLIKESKDYLKEVDNLTNAYNTISKEEFDKINSILPECGLHEELFSQMDNIVKKNGLLLTSISIKPESYSDQIETGDKETTFISQQKKKITLSFSLGGIDYTGVKNFLKDIETNLRIMDVTSLSFDPANDFLSLNIQTYCLE